MELEMTQTTGVDEFVRMQTPFHAINVVLSGRETDSAEERKGLDLLSEVDRNL